jgi:hypothetical protein
MSSPVHYQTDLHIDSRAGRFEGRLEASLHLDEPRTRIELVVPNGTVGRAEARFDERNWAAAHYWTEETAAGNVVLFEFSEPLPAGDLSLVVPFSGELTPGVAAAAGAPTDARRLESALPHLPGPAGEWKLRVS